MQVQEAADCIAREVFLKRPTIEASKLNTKDMKEKFPLGFMIRVLYYWLLLGQENYNISIYICIIITIYIGSQ